MPENAWPYATLQEVAGVLAATDDGLTGKQIGDLLHRLGMEDPLPDATKRDRLTEAFVRRQNQDGSPRRLITFVIHAMEPVRYCDRPELFTLRQDRLNERLAFVGLHLTDSGTMARGARASTLDEATHIATSVRDELARRQAHAEVLRYCTLEVLKRDHFHAVLEATKGIFDRLRAMTGETADGAASGKHPQRRAVDHPLGNEGAGSAVVANDALVDSEFVVYQDGEGAVAVVVGTQAIRDADHRVVAHMVADREYGRGGSAGDDRQQVRRGGRARSTFGGGGSARDGGHYERQRGDARHRQEKSVRSHGSLPESGSRTPRTLGSAGAGWATPSWRGNEAWRTTQVRDSAHTAEEQTDRADC